MTAAPALVARSHITAATATDVYLIRQLFVSISAAYIYAKHIRTPNWVDAIPPPILFYRLHGIGVTAVLRI